MMETTLTIRFVLHCRGLRQQAVCQRRDCDGPSREHSRCGPDLDVVGL